MLPFWIGVGTCTLGLAMASLQSRVREPPTRQLDSRVTSLPVHYIFTALLVPLAGSVLSEMTRLPVAIPFYPSFYSRSVDHALELDATQRLTC